MTGTLNQPFLSEDFTNLSKIISSDKNFGRVLWIPRKSPLGFSDPIHPSIEAEKLTTIRPFYIGIVGTYELFNFLREEPFVDELLSVSGVGCIAYPFPDTRREDLKQDNIDYYFAFLDQLRNLDWTKDSYYNYPVSVLETRNHKDHFFMASNLWFVVGSDRIYWDLSKIDNFELSDNPLVFVEEGGDLGARIDDYLNSKVILFNKNLEDLAASFIDQSELVFPADGLDFDPDVISGWWKREDADLIAWRAFLQEKYGIDNLDFSYGGGWAVGEGSLKLKVQSSRFVKENILLARVMESSKGGVVRFYQSGELVGDIDTRLEEPKKVEIKLTGYGQIPDQYFEYSESNIRWFEIGKLVEDGSLNIQTEGDINVVNALVVISEEKWRAYQLTAKELLDSKRVVLWDDLSDREKRELFENDSEVKLSYSRKSPAEYLVNIEGLDKPGTLVFSETYDPLWKANGQSSFPVYSLLNGFYLEKDGQYKVFFEPQKYVLPGLLISGATVIVLLFFFLKFRRR